MRSTPRRVVGRVSWAHRVPSGCCAPTLCRVTRYQGVPCFAHNTAYPHIGFLPPDGPLGLPSPLSQHVKITVLDFAEDGDRQVSSFDLRKTEMVVSEAFDPGPPDEVARHFANLPSYATPAQGSRFRRTVVFGRPQLAAGRRTETRQRYLAQPGPRTHLAGTSRAAVGRAVLFPSLNTCFVMLDSALDNWYSGSHSDPLNLSISPSLG
jgi:hypothetical protein